MSNAFATSPATSSARSTPATRSRSWSRRWRARPTSSSPGCSEASPLTTAREYDAVVASGELVTAGLLAIVLQGHGLPRALVAGLADPDRAPTTPTARPASPESTAPKIIDGFAAARSPSSPASRACTRKPNRITTLGRGGSDTCAVALAAALNADRCDIYTDVDGVYTTDPRIVPKARRLDKISFEEMLEMASLGVEGAAGALGRSRDGAQGQALSCARRSTTPPTARPGTLICDEEDIVEQQVVTGIAFSRDEAQITLRRVADKPGVAAAIFGPLADANINVDMIIQVVSDDTTTTDITFTVPSAEYKRAMAILEERKAAIGYTVLTGR